MDIYKYQFSVFTPCFNSENTIDRVFNSLMKQTISHSLFEWIVIDDASTDNTYEILKKYVKLADFKVKLIKNKKNLMLIRNYNIGIKNAEGELFVSIGHDDMMKPNALEILLNNYKKIKDKENYRAIICNTVDQDGNLVGTKFPQNGISLYPEDFLKFKIKGEKRGASFTRVLKRNLFPENIDLYISEQAHWLNMDKKYKVYCINDPLFIYFRNKGDKESLSKSKKLRYIKGGVYSTLVILNYFNTTSYIRYNLQSLIIHYINLSRLSCHIKQCLKPFKKLNSIDKKILFLFFLPLGLVKMVLDIIQKRK